MKKVFLLLGSNLGDRNHSLASACHRLKKSAGKLVSSSAVYRTAAWGNTDQPEFYNQAIALATALSPMELLHTCLQIEAELGRERIKKWGERVIDIDILFYEGEIINLESLQIPHPQIAFRRFTLVPLAEIAPDFIHPVLNKTVTRLLQECSDELGVTRLN